MCDNKCFSYPDWKFRHSYCYCILFVINITLLIGGLIIAGNFVKENQSKKLAYEAYTVVNECSDSYTILPAEEISSVLEAS